MSGFQKYGLFGGTVNGESGENDAKLFKKYSTKITWGERVFYRRNPQATVIYEITSFPQKLTEYEVVNGTIDTKDRHRYIDVYDNGFLLFENRVYRFGQYDTNAPEPYPFVPSDTLHEDESIDVTTIDTELPYVFIAQASSIWYWRGEKYIYACDFDCINTTPITTTTDEMIAGGIAKMQVVALKTQAFNELPDDFLPTRFDIIAWGGNLYIVDEQDSIPHYRPALVTDTIISMTKLL